MNPHEPLADTASRRLRYGVVGCGRAFQRLHLPVVAEYGALEIVGLCESAPGTANGIPGQLRDIPCFTEITAFLDTCRPDVVAVCTPNNAHAEAVLAALDRGVAVLCEKPLAGSIDDARRMVAHAAGDALLAVNLPYRHSRLLGRLATVIATYPCVDVRAEIRTPGPRLWRPRTQWYRTPDVAGGGALLDIGLHLLDPLDVLFGPLNITSCTVDDPALEERATVELAFTRGMGSLVVDRAARTAQASLTVRDPGSDRWCTLDLRRGKLSSESGPIAATDQAIEQAAIRQFLDLCAGAGGTYVPGSAALALQELVTCAYRRATRLSDTPPPAD